MTLVEVLVASVLLGVGVTGLLMSATLGIRNQQKSEQRMAGLYVAQAKLAEIEVIGPRIWALSEPAKGTEPGGEVAYQWVSSITSMGEGELYDVHVQVTWSGPSGGGQVDLETLLNDYRAKAVMKAEGGAEPTAGKNTPAGGSGTR